MGEIRLKKIRPFFTKILTTADQYLDEDATTQGGIIDVTKLKKGFKEYQRVIAVGNSCRFVKEGDLISINPARYAKPTNVNKHMQETDKSLRDELIVQSIKYVFPVVTLYNEENIAEDYLFLDEGDVEFVIEEHDEI